MNLFNHVPLFRTLSIVVLLSLSSSLLASSSDSDSDDSSSSTSPARLVTTLEGHRELLKNAIKGARNRIIIASPYISSLALRDDELAKLFEKKAQKGVKITIFTDEKLDKYNGQLKDNAAKGRDLLRALGLDLRIIKNVHAKVLIKDSDLIAIGSFNWLSAVRNPKSIYCNHEQSTVFEGSTAKWHIKRSLAALEDIEEKQTAYANFYNKFQDLKKEEDLGEYLMLVEDANKKGLISQESYRACSEEIQELLGEAENLDATSKKWKNLQEHAINSLYNLGIIEEIEEEEHKASLQEDND